MRARNEALASTVTTREHEVLRALAGRRTNREIAGELLIGVRTVESHISSLLRKLWAEDRRALEAIADAHGATRRASSRSRSVSAAVALLVLVLTACGSGSSDADTTERAAATSVAEPAEETGGAAETGDTAQEEPVATPVAEPAEETVEAAETGDTAQEEPVATSVTEPAEETGEAEETAETAETEEEDPADDGTAVEIAPRECTNLGPCAAVLRTPSPLFDGAMVDIEIAGWTPSQTVGIAQCADPAGYPEGRIWVDEASGLPHESFCDVRSFTRVRSSPDGDVVWTYELRGDERMAERTGSHITCDAEHPCILNVFASDALMFKPDAPRVVFPLDFG